MIIENNKPVKACVCDHVSCGATRRSDVDIAWQMYGIHFGVDPSARKNESVVTRINGFNFCERHSPVYEDIIYALMLRNGALEGGKFSTSEKLIGGLGCWITMIDVFGGHSPRNFQMVYEPFAKVYLAFVALGVGVKMWGPLSFQEKVKELKRLHK